LRSTSLLFCQTEIAKKRLRATYGEDVRIEICPNQLSRYVLPPDGSEKIPTNLRAYEGKFKLLVLTRYYPHKNLEVIVEVFWRFRHELRDVMAILTVCPDESLKAKKFFEKVHALGLDEQIVSVGALKQEELAAFYMHTDALFLPTLLESYSGTYVEAMSYGRPILTSDLDFARSVCGDAALYFDPNNVDDILEKILIIKENIVLRMELVAAGAARCNERCKGWDVVAEGVLAELEWLCNRKAN